MEVQLGSQGDNMTGIFLKPQQCARLVPRTFVWSLSVLRPIVYMNMYLQKQNFVLFLTNVDADMFLQSINMRIMLHRYHSIVYGYSAVWIVLDTDILCLQTTAK